MRRHKNYHNYSVQQWISDASFQDWVLHPDAEKDAFWNDWLAAYPENWSSIEQAVTLLSNLRFKVDLPGSGNAAASLSKAWKLIDEKVQGAVDCPTKGIALQTGTSPVSAGQIRWRRRGWQIAAMWTVLLAAGIMGYFLLHSREMPLRITTAFGQLDTVYLPDHSMVVLNAHSTLRYQKTWRPDQVREVWLNGEALFDIRHLDQDSIIDPNERFVVHVGHTDVEVLGTTFDIRQRRGKVEVALLKGSVRLHFDQERTPDVLMQPGDVVVMDTLLREVQKFRANTHNYAVWTQKQLMLTDPSLQEIVNYLEDIYGKRIVLADPALALRKVTGPIMLDSLDDALFIISTVLNVRITQQKDCLLIQSP